MRLKRKHSTGNQDRLAARHSELPRIRGWLLVYTAALAAFLLHGAVLTGGSILAYANPGALGLRSTVPLGFLVYYDITNVALLAYGITLFFLMARRRKSAIVHNVIFNILAVVFLVSWHLIGEKSTIGTAVDSLPNLAGVLYILLSTRVRTTFIVNGPGRDAPLAA
jgi:hypothetical protein